MKVKTVLITGAAAAALFAYASYGNRDNAVQNTAAYSVRERVDQERDRVISFRSEVRKGDQENAMALLRDMTPSDASKLDTYGSVQEQRVINKARSKGLPIGSNTDEYSYFAHIKVGE